MVIAALFITTKKWKQLKCLLIDEWIDTMWSIHMMKYYSAREVEVGKGRINGDRKRLDFGS